MARAKKALWPDADVVKLNLRGMKLNEWPDGLEQLTRLEQLYVEDNQLRTVPEVLTRLPSLHTLALARNPISEFPDEVMVKLPRLHSLDLGGTRIKSLPASVARCEVLTKVNLEEMGEDFNWNQALELLRGLPRLVSLGLGRNCFDVIPAGVFKLRSLRLLYLNECELASVPPEMATLDKLEVLSLWKNRLESLPDEIAEMASLGSLVISKNPGTRRMKHRLLKKLGARMLIS